MVENDQIKSIKSRSWLSRVINTVCIFLSMTPIFVAFVCKSISYNFWYVKCIYVLCCMRENDHVAKWLRRSVSKFAGCTRVGSNPVAGTTNHKPAATSAVHPSKVDKWVLRGNSEGKTRSAAGPHQLYSCQEPSLHSLHCLHACLFACLFAYLLIC